MARTSPIDENSTVRPEVSTRRATVADVDTLLADVQSGFDSYVDFAPLGWRPPDISANRARSIELLADPGTWALLALLDNAPIGHVAFFSARDREVGEQRRDRGVIPGLGHLWQLFVIPEYWGCGVAALLHDAAVAEMRAQGYERARLLTPSLHVRARRFYEKRRWTAAREEWNADLSLMLTEYRLVLE